MKGLSTNMQVNSILKAKDYQCLDILFLLCQALINRGTWFLSKTSEIVVHRNFSGLVL